MKENKKDQQEIIKMRISQIIETKFSINEKISMMTDLNENHLKMQLGFNLSPDMSKNFFTVTIMMSYKYEVNGMDQDLVNLDVANVFEIQNIADYFEFKDNNFNDKAKLVPQMLNVAIGSTRGMLAAKVAGTILSKYPLPIIDVNTILSNSKLN